MPAERDRDQWVTGRLLGTAARLVEHSWNVRLREHGVSHAGLIVLSTLGCGPTGQRDLAADQHVTEQTIGRTIAHLESTGHVVRELDPADRRRRVVALTESGATLLSEMFDTGERITDDILRAAGVDIAQFRRTLETLIQAMDPATAPQRTPQGSLPDSPGITRSE
jgi:DNA-binding MarR family transcriptional regulator